MANVKINQLPSGSYNAKVYDYTTADGKRKYKSITASSKSEVKRLIAVFLAEREELHTEREQKEANPEAFITLGEAIDKYIASNNNIFSPSTLREYKQIRRNAFPDLMNVSLHNITSDMVQEAVNREAAVLSPKTVHGHHGLISAVLKQSNPDLRLNTALPRKVKSDIVIPTEADMKMILTAVKGSPLEISVYLAALCGMRRSEIAALKWSDIDFKTGTLSIHSAKVYGDENRYIEKATKTTAGKRTIYLFTPVLELLKRSEKREGYVCEITPSMITDQFSALLKRHGIRHCRFHDLRHYCVSVMLALNMPKKYIADYVGHENEQMIDRVYGHIMHEAKENFIKAVNGYFVEQMQHEMQHE